MTGGSAIQRAMSTRGMLEQLLSDSELSGGVPGPRTPETIRAPGREPPNQAPQGMRAKGFHSSCRASAGEAFPRVNSPATGL
jgi:hypothetical protein